MIQRINRKRTKEIAQILANAKSIEFNPDFAGVEARPATADEVMENLENIFSIIFNPNTNVYHFAGSSHLRYYVNY